MTPAPVSESPLPQEELTREIFGNISPASKLVFYVLAVVSLAVCAYGVWQRVRLWKLGRANPARSGMATANVQTEVCRFGLAARGAPGAAEENPRTTRRKEKTQRADDVEMVLRRMRADRAAGSASRRGDQTSMCSRPRRCLKRGGCDLATSTRRFHATAL